MVDERRRREIKGEKGNEDKGEEEDAEKEEERKKGSERWVKDNGKEGEGMLKEKE